MRKFKYKYVKNNEEKWNKMLEVKDYFRKWYIYIYIDVEFIKESWVKIRDYIVMLENY